MRWSDVPWYREEEVEVSRCFRDLSWGWYICASGEVYAPQWMRGYQKRHALFRTFTCLYDAPWSRDLQHLRVNAGAFLPGDILLRFWKSD